MKRIGILLSGRGSNFLAIANAIKLEILKDAEIGVVLSDREDAGGLTLAREMKLPAIAVPAAGRSRADQEDEIIASLQRHNIDLVCLAGYMRIISPEFVAAFPDRIINIHPSLLPSFPGLHAQKQALEAGVKVAGCTVHFVDEKVDHGVIIVQRAITVGEDDTAETLAARILEQEHLAYPEAIARVTSGNYRIEMGRYLKEGVTAL